MATRYKKIYVKSGQSIQNAIDGAPSGSKIIVAKGVYNEQLLITKDDITLIGEHGAVLEPPAKYVENGCYLLAGNVTTPAGDQTDVIIPHSDGRVETDCEGLGRNPCWYLYHRR